MDAGELLQRFHPEEHYRRCLADGLRPDGRQPRERRKARLQRSSFASAHGSASVRLGDSAAVAGVRAEVTQAVPELPPRGHVSVTVELPPLCSSAFRERNRASGLSTFLSSAFVDILNSPHVFCPAQLDIREGEVFWVLHLHIVCLNYDGNAFDLCLLAAVAALEDTLLPALAEDDAPATDAFAARLVTVPLGAPEAVTEARHAVLLCRPVPVTFAQMPGKQFVVDPCAVEEEIGASVSLCLVGNRWLVYHQGGASAEQFLGQLMPSARACVPDLVELLDQATEGDTDASARQPAQREMQVDPI